MVGVVADRISDSLGPSKVSSWAALYARLVEQSMWGWEQSINKCQVRLFVDCKSPMKSTTYERRYR
jgi:hypothetical protein